MKLKDCFNCVWGWQEYGFTLKQSHSYNHFYSYGDFDNMLYPIRTKGHKHKQLISKGGKP